MAFLVARSPTLFYFPGLTSRPVWRGDSSDNSITATLTDAAPAADNNNHGSGGDNGSGAGADDATFPWLRELERPENVAVMKQEYLSLLEVDVVIFMLPWSLCPVCMVVFCACFGDFEVSASTVGKRLERSHYCVCVHRALRNVYNNHDLNRSV